MTDLLPIQSLTPEKIRRAVESPQPLASVDEFVASVDWSTIDGEPSGEVAQLLGEAEGLATEASEGEISVERFVEAIDELATTVRA